MKIKYMKIGWVIFDIKRKNCNNGATVCILNAIHNIDDRNYDIACTYINIYVCVYVCVI